MANGDSLEMHVDIDTFISANDQLQGQIDALGGILGEYQTLKSNVENFIEGSDSNFNKMQENVEENIKAVRAELAEVQQTKAQIQHTITSMEEMGTNTQTILDEGTQAAGQAVRAAIKLDELGII